MEKPRKKRMKLYITILSTTLFLITLSYPAWTGTSWKTLSSTTNIINIDEKKRADDALRQAGKDADKASSTIGGYEFYIWILSELDRNIEEPRLFHLDMALVSEQVKRFKEDPEFFNKYDRNDLRLAVKAKDFVKARKIVKEAQNRMHPGAAVFCGSQVIP